MKEILNQGFAWMKSLENYEGYDSCKVCA